MKILLINKYFYPKGGSERAFFDMAEILQKRGHEVAFFSMKHIQNRPSRYATHFIENIDYEKKIGFWKRFQFFFKMLWNLESQKKLESLLDRFHPDIAHMHSIYHQISPSIIHTLKKRNIPVVMTMHDYHLISPNYVLFANGKIDEKSLKNPISCVFGRCIKGSLVASAASVLEFLFHRYVTRMYAKVDRFIAPSEFMKNLCMRHGISADKISVIHNPLLLQTAMGETLSPSEDYFLYFGRLSEEKGIPILLSAMQKTKNKLVIVGEGSKKAEYERMAVDLGIADRVKFRGFMYGKDLMDIITGAKAVIIPSVWYENWPYSVLEALSMGKVVIAANIGGIPEMIEHGKNGLLFQAGDADSLAAIIDSLETHDMPSLSREAKISVLRFSAGAFHRELMEAYHAASR